MGWSPGMVQGRRSLSMSADLTDERAHASFRSTANYMNDTDLKKVRERA